MPEPEPKAQDEPQSRAEVVANLVVVALLLIAIGGGLLVYVDRDGLGRTQDAVVAADSIRVTANVSGPIDELAVVDNQRVEAGALLFRIDRRPFEARVEAAKGQHAAALATAKDAQIRLKRVQEEYDAGSVVSRQSLDDATAAADHAQAEVAETAGLLALAQVELAYCEVHAPFAGIVTGLDTQVGEYVSAGDTIFALIDADSFHVLAYMKEQYLAPAVPGARAEVTLWQYPDEVFDGEVVSVARGVYTLDNVSGVPVVEKTLDWVQLAARIPVRIRLDTDRPLTMGTTAHVRIVE